MSFTSGINNLQQPITSIASSDVKVASKVDAPDSAFKPNEGSTASVAQVDQALLSSTGGLVAQALEGTDARSAKVASLQQAIVAGNYHVSSSDVADKIIQSLLG